MRMEKKSISVIGKHISSSVSPKLLYFNVSRWMATRVKTFYNEMKGRECRWWCMIWRVVLSWLPCYSACEETVASPKMLRSPLSKLLRTFDGCSMAVVTQIKRFGQLLNNSECRMQNYMLRTRRNEISLFRWRYSRNDRYVSSVVPTTQSLVSAPLQHTKRLTEKWIVFAEEMR